jgi:MoaA/NifB/PqqE/SkfB family radical SAM enzyme
MQYKGGNLIKKTEYQREDRLKLNLDSNLKILSLGNDYSCNLKCPSCRSDTLKMSIAEIQEQLNRFNKLIDSIGSELKLIHIAGDGDPFASQFYHQIIAKTNWVRFPNLSIRFQTNGNALTPKKWDVLPAIVKKKTIEIGISIDGASKGTYEKLRLGGDFGDVMNNLSFLSPVPEVKRGDIKLNINMIVQVDNFREIINFIEMGQRFSVHTTSFTYLRNWGTFSDFEYKSKAVHLSSHPLHNELLDLLKNPLVHNSNVDLGNLSHLI